MIKVRKEDAIKLHEDYGICYGENGLSKTHSHHHPHYYLTESEHNIRALLDFSTNAEAKAILDKIERKKRRWNKKKHN